MNTRHEANKIWTFIGLLILSGLAMSIEQCRHASRIEALEQRQ